MGNVIVDRLLGLCEGDALFGTEDPRSGAFLPVEDRQWIENVRSLVQHTLPRGHFG